MEEERTVVSFTFRAGPFSKAEAEEALEVCKSIKFKVRERMDGKGSVLSAKLIEGNDYTELQSLVKAVKLPRERYDISFGLLSNADSIIEEMPAYVEDVVKMIDAKIVFNYTEW